MAATTTLSPERYPFCVALHWIVVAAGVFCSLNREISATATRTAHKSRIFFPNNSDRADTMTKNGRSSRRKRRRNPRDSLAFIWTNDYVVMPVKWRSKVA
jgi:hypothetical protein